MSPRHPTTCVRAIQVTAALGTLFIAAWVYPRLPFAEKFEEKFAWLSTREQQSNRRSALITYHGAGSPMNQLLASQLTDPPKVSISKAASGWSVSKDPAFPDQQLRYTLDGSIPDRSSRTLSDRILIETTSVLRVRRFQFGRLPSMTTTRLLPVDVRHKLPVVSLVTDPANLWHAEAGIYSAWNNSKSKLGPRWASLSYEDKLQVDGRLELHGGLSRSLPRKSLRFRFSSSSVADVDLGNALTARTTAPERVVILRGGGNNNRWLLVDELFTLVYSDTRGLGDCSRFVSPFETVNLYLNGKYWGLYNIRERIDGAFVRRQSGPGDYELIKLDLRFANGAKGPKPVAVAGDTEGWLELMDLARRGDPEDPTHFASLASLIDIDAFLDYWIYQVYGANQDWPKHNVFAFRGPGKAAKWRWIVWDVDQTLGLDEPRFSEGRQFVPPDEKSLELATTIEKPSVLPDAFGGDAGGTLLIHHLLENRSCRERFVTRTLDLLNTAFVPERIEEKLSFLLNHVGSDRALDLRRWDTSQEQFDEVVSRIREFVKGRPAHLRAQLRERFGLGLPVPVSVDVRPPGAGEVQLNTVRLDRFPWQGVYLRGSPLRLVAHAAPGFRFVGWEVDSSAAGSTPSIALTPEQPTRCVGVFEPRRP